MRPTVQDGFALWCQEAEANKAGYTEVVPYLAIIPLVGIYTSLRIDTLEPTSYEWRHTVLANQSALTGLRHVLGSHAVDIDVSDSSPVEASGEHDSWQATRINESIHDGLPLDKVSMPWNEEFLAKHLGLAVHDDTVRFSPLRLLDQGWYAMRNYYPITANYLSELS